MTNEEWTFDDEPLDQDFSEYDLRAHRVVAPSADHSAVLHRAEDAHWVTIGDDIVIYRAAATTSFVLSAVAGLVWQCLDGESTLAEILTDVAEAFGVDETRVFDDFLPAIGEWIADEVVVDPAKTVARISADSVADAEPWRRLESPPNECGKAELSKWPDHVVIGLGGTAITVAADDPSIIETLRPWQIGAETQLVDFVLELDPPRATALPSTRRLPALSNGCQPLFRLREPAVLVETFWRVLASHTTPLVPGQIRVRLMPIVWGGRALLVPASHGGKLSHRWYQRRHMLPLYTVSSVIDVASWTVRVDPSLLDDGQGPDPQWYPILDWWLPSADPAAGISAGEAVAHVMRWSAGITADNAEETLSSVAAMVQRQHPGLAPAAPERVLEQFSPATADEIRSELMAVIVERFER